jgi:hypothetical protein
MKTRIYFEPEDFRSMGQMIIRQSSPIGSNDIGFMASVSYKIGWKSKSSGPNGAVKISLSDGMCIEYETIEKLCEILNNDVQGFRPMSQDEIDKVMSYNGNRF